jgi:predicted metal-dependent hydrolase
MTSALKVRTPNFDFREVPVHWATNIELVQMINATNLVPAYIEPFLIKVTRRAKALLDPHADAELIEDLDVFNKQEAQHFKVHAAFNRRMREAGYDGMAEIEAAFEAEYDQMLTQRSLRFLLAYCEGFEAAGGVATESWVNGDFDRHLGPTASEPGEMWRWHLAEEYEHRTVIHRLYHRLYGQPKVIAWPYRLYGFFFSLRHFGGHVDRMTRYLLSVDHASLDAPARAEAAARMKAVRRQMRLSMQMTRKALNVLSPGYDPARLPKPRDYEAVLARYS